MNSVRTEARLRRNAADPQVQKDPHGKNFHAKLAGLNSLNRNFHAYLHTQSPRFAALAAFVVTSAQYESARSRLAARNHDLTTAEARLGALVEASGIEPYDGAVGVYNEASLADLQDRLSYLNSVAPAPDDEDAYNAERDALTSILSSDEAADVSEAQSAVDEAEARAAASSIGTDDHALKEALSDAANRNRLAQYGDDYIDGAVMDWAKDVLGVGDSFGKIDEVRQYLDAGQDSD